MSTAQNPPPQACSIELLGQEVPYVLKRSARRSLGLTIDGRGLTVSIPLRLSHREAERFMQERARWILDKLVQQAARTKPQALDVVDGMQLWVHGRPCVLHLRQGNPQVRWLEDEHRLQLHLQLKAGTDPKRALLRSLQQRALSYFSGRLEEYLHLLGLHLQTTLPPPPLRLSNARGRWGSCSRRSGIRLNWRLIHLPQGLIDYVVAHEIAHLVEMNHSPRFWAVVAQLCPEYQSARAALRDVSQFVPAW